MKESEATSKNAVFIGRAIEAMHEATLEMDKIIIGSLSEQMVRELRRLRKAVHSLSWEIERGVGMVLSDADTPEQTLGGAIASASQDDHGDADVICPYCKKPVCGSRQSHQGAWWHIECIRDHLDMSS